MKRVLVAMSGGIDSSLAAVLLKEQGYEVIGVTIKSGDYSDSSYIKSETLCCNYDSINDARAIAVKEGFPHYVVDMTAEFESKIILDFINEYLAGRTPNPCVRCNPLIKSSALLKIADRLECEYIATGHYAKIRHEDNRYLISKGADESKDQSYVLWGLKQENLKRTLFPIGDYYKDEIKKLAEEKGFLNLINKRESYEICFIPDNDYRGYLQSKVPGLKDKYKGGNFITEEGKILGKHEGYPFYTIGQRKGLQVAVGEPLYVKEIHPESNEIVLAKKDSLRKNELTVNNYNLIKYELHELKQITQVTTKIRYHDKGTKSELRIENGELRVIFEEGVFAVTPGQSAVFYEGDDLVGGGIIV
jgi:tRNA-uridine 2-sulfurtransferase